MTGKLAGLSPEEKRALAARLLGQRPRRYPLSFGQRRLWFLDRFTPGDPVYNMPLPLRLTGALRPDLLQRALDAIVARHGALRTTFAEQDGEPVQVVAATGTLPLSTVDSAGDGEAAHRLVVREARRPFDLTTGPLARTVLVRIAPDDHILLVTLHHIVADALSADRLFDELHTLYAAYEAGTEPDLPALTVQYGDYAAWQRAQLDGAELERLLAYWTAALAGAPPRLDLPTDHPRPAVQTYRGALYTLRLDPALSAGVQRLSRDTGCTPFMTVLAAYQLVLARYCGQRDIVVGTPVASRSRAELEPLIGLFVNSLALRTRLDGTSTFAELLAQVRETTLAALSHQDLPFEKLVEVLQPERSLGHAPVFQVQMNFQHEPLPTLAMPGLTSRIEPVDTGTAKLDLTLTALPAPTGMALELEYNADLFDPSTVERFGESLRAVLAAVTHRPDTRLDDVDLLSEPERRRLITAPNLAARPLAASTAVDVLAPRLWAAGAPADRVVATAGGRDLTSGELAAWSARVARVLADAGAGPDTLVGLCVDRSADLLAGLLGVWRAGAAYVPLDPAFPVDRLRAMAADAGLRIVVTQKALRGLVGELTDARVVCVDDLPGTAAAGTAAEAPAVAVRGDHLAYTIFTSGSTGRPKGVAVPHVAVANLLESFVDSLRLGPADRFVAVTTLSFDIAVLELALPLLCGARLVVASREEAADPAALRALLAASGATVMQATPATWRMLVASGGIPATVHTRLCGGEALPRDLATDLATGGARLWNVYGPTETTVWSAAGLVEPAPAPVVVGPPIANTRVYTLDGGLRPVPVGVVGEVYLGGLGLARGYHGRAGLTAQRFLPDPFAGRGARMYRTGDLARWRADLTLEFLGRVDHQVKVRGFRIETGEIEAALLDHAAIRDAVVAASAVDGDTRLVAYVVPEPPDATAAALWPDVQTHLRGWLPEYMVPAVLVALPDLPRTPNGKVDRRALPAPVWIAATPFVAAMTPAERVVARIWAELLGVAAPIGVHDDFFALGGHSLSATQVVARIRAALGANVRLRTLFAGPTVAQLAAAVTADPKYRPPADDATAERPDAVT